MKLKLITALTACAMLVTAFSGCAPKSQKYSIDGPIVQQEIQYEVMIDTELAVEFLKGSSSMYLNEGHGEGAYIAHNPFHTLELDKSRVLTGMAYFPIINDGKIIDAIVALPADETVFCMNTSGSTDWELINEKLSANPDAQWLFCTIGTVGVLLSSENEVVTFTKDVDEDITRFFDDSVDWFAHFNNEYSAISYNELIAENAGE